MYDDKIIENIKDRIINKKETISIAESVTAGMLQNALSNAESAADFFQGGIIAYSLEQKCKHLSVDRKTAEACNCVSGEIAGQMALNICNLFGTDWGVGITGYATPVPESNNKLFAYYAIAYNGKIVATERLEARQDKSFNVQLYYVNEVLKKLVKVI